ncbi:MAG: glycogen synthase GlgA [Parachlamydiales bacterium]|jgi:starch synthase
MHIVHLASELAPVAKVGGLGDVLLGLSRELSWKGHDVDIIIPKYDCMNSNEIRDLTVFHTNLMSFFEGGWHPNTIWVGWVENLKVYFIEPHHARYFFNRGCYYGCEDDTDRFLYFARTAMEFMFKSGLRPNIIHLHDWQTAICAPLYKDMYSPLGLNSAKIVFTIHNMEYQGKCSKSNLDNIGMLGSNYLVPNKLQDNHDDQLINLMKGGIIYSDFFTTVSPNYAKEVMSPDGGRGLEKTLQQNAFKFAGILNGIDYSFWNPEIDRYLPAHYSVREKPLDKKDLCTLDKKGFIKQYLREKLALNESHRPLVGCVTRLVPQKGIDLIKFAIKYVEEHNGQFILLGSGPIPSIMAEFHELKEYYDDNPNVSIILNSQEDMSHLIYAASDMFIVPSLFEPCGLTQMIALKYGSIPIVRKTGGLADTIFDVDNSGRTDQMADGYTFDNPNNKEFEAALARALDCWFHHQDKWRKMMVNGMSIDFSWNHPADKYLQIYEGIMQEKKTILN